MRQERQYPDTGIGAERRAGIETVDYGRRHVYVEAQAQTIQKYSCKYRYTDIDVGIYT